MWKPNVIEQLQVKLNSAERTYIIKRRAETLQVVNYF